MPRISRLTGLRSLQSAVTPVSPAARTSFAAASRGISTTQPAAGSSTEWVRGKLWKGDAPGPEDPYTQRPVVGQTSNLPNEALEQRWGGDLVQPAVRGSQLAFPPKRTEATIEKEAQAIDPNYIPATTLEELEEVGTLKTWWEQPGHWSEQSQFKGFGNTAKATDKNVVEAYLRRAVVEVLALKQAGVFSQWATKSWRVGTREELEAAVSAPITVKDGELKLPYPISTRSIISQDRSAEYTELLTKEEAKKMVRRLNPSWKEIVLDNEFKFALRKRLYQLTGNLIPDAKLGAARTVKHVLTLASKEPAPTKLVETLEKRSALPSLPNVSLHSRRITPIDKEIAVGRWKVIEEELKKRDLPVTGTAGLKRNKEMDWVLGNE